MKKLIIVLLILSACLQFSAYGDTTATSPAEKHSFRPGDGVFLLDGEPFTIKAAELHYPRIPRDYWEQRILMCKALGMNTICLYTFWNIHESAPGVYDFSGQNDIAGFIRLCEKNGMKVILRPGPYVCAEWEMGGLPWWLLKKKDIRLREDDPYFMERVGKFQEALAAELSEMTVDKGGPIIMIQVENEYGAYGKDKKYVSAIRDILRENYGPDVAMFQCDWSSNYLDNALPDLLWTMNFGTGANIDEQFASLKSERPLTPLMCSEFWSGWFDKWGANHETRPSDDMIAGIDEMLSKGISFSLYMTHGGTNFGHWAGANSPGFSPDVTSYDYDAPISESGRTTPKYHALRETLARYAGGESLPDIPEEAEPMHIAKFIFSEVAPLAENLPAPVHDEKIRTMEEYDQGFGSILYSTRMPGLDAGAVLSVNDPHDYAQVFINGEYIGTLDRRLGEKELRLPAVTEGAVLDILVEAMGRINFGRAIKDFKGITENVTLTFKREGRTETEELSGWDVFNIHDSYPAYSSMQFRPLDSTKAASGSRLPRGAYRGYFTIEGKPTDTFLNFETWGKGLVYVNGHAIGRIWEIGPQQTLYMPGPWLKSGENEIIVFDILGPVDASSEGLKEPILDRLYSHDSTPGKNTDRTADFSNETPVLAGEFRPGNGWQEVAFPKSARGRYLAIEAIDAIDGGDMAAIAELYVRDTSGNILSREAWTVVFADSEDTDGANRSADKTFDLQESTYWQTRQGSVYPHSIIIDLGGVHDIAALRYLPRMEAGAPGAIKRFKVFLKEESFDI